MKGVSVTRRKFCPIHDNSTWSLSSDHYHLNNELRYESRGVKLNPTLCWAFNESTTAAAPRDHFHQHLCKSARRRATYRHHHHRWPKTIGIKTKLKKSRSLAATAASSSRGNPLNHFGQRRNKTFMGLPL